MKKKYIFCGVQMILKTEHKEITAFGENISSQDNVLLNLELDERNLLRDEAHNEVDKFFDKIDKHLKNK